VLNAYGGPPSGKDIARDRAFLEGGGKTGALMRAHDWSHSPLGAPETWPQSLRAIVALLLHSKFPMFVAWGRELGFLYNDPYAEILGAKHPQSLGARFYDIWSEIWPDISPLIDAALAGEASYREDLPLVMNRLGYDEQTWFTFSYSPVRDESGQIAGMFCACSETTERKKAEDALRQSRGQIEAELSDTKLLQALGAELIHEADTDALYEKVIDAATAIMRSDFASMQMYHPERGRDGELRLLTFRGFDARAAKFWEWVGVDSEGTTCGPALRSRERVIAVDVEECDDIAGTEHLKMFRQTGIRACQSTPLLARSGNLVGMISTHWRNPYRPTDGQLRLLDFVARQAADILERNQARQTEQLLVEELNHRVKNTLASVQAIVQHTLRSAKDPAHFASSFSGRIQSMARAHSLLTSTVWKGADLRDVIRDQLQLGPIDQSRLTAWGPPVRMPPQMVQHVALMLHELGTNSAKYGALSRAQGRVTINWSVEDMLLRLKWVEQGGPPVSAPIKRGFGSTLIEQSARSEGGEAHMSVGARGIAWDITVPLPANVPLLESATHSLVNVGASDHATAAPAAEPPPLLSGRRFLVVEDEPLVSMDLVAGLEEEGAEVVGPAGTPEEALELIDASAIDAALLDGNLRGRPVDNIAAALTRRQIPFVYVTGYDRQSLPQGFGEASILSKPFSREQLREAACQLVAPPAGIVRLRGGER
jgi:two-component sensor histidine kinase/CheY-like chemotaxis protein